MSGVLFDYTRVISALGRAPGKQHLVVADLAKVVEAVVLYESIYTTEGISSHYSRTLSQGHGGLFDLSKAYIYDAIFKQVFRTVPPAVDAKVGHDHLALPRRTYADRSVIEADIAVLSEARKATSSADFQFLGSTIYSDEQLLRTLERVRLLTAVAGELGVAYDPIPYRVPLLRLSIPGNLASGHLGPYRQFERGVQVFIKELLHDKMGFEVPMMLAIVLRECRAGFPDDIFANAVQLRNDPLLIRLRAAIGEHTVAYESLNLPAIAKTDRLVKEELSNLKARISGEFRSGFKLSLKPAWFPLAIGWDVKAVIQAFRDRQQRIPLANLTRMTSKALTNIGKLLPTLAAVVPVANEDQSSRTQ